jgi:prepilin-type N-terminal cleavage/methylation domain-containing protein
MKFKKKNIRGLSLTEVLIAMTISTLIFSAAYLMYDQFKASFERQLGLSDLQGEARVAMLNLDLDTKKAGYSSPNTLPVKRPVLTPTNSISFCYDEKTVRKRVVYSLNTTDKTITRSVYEVNITSITNQTNNCNPDGISTTTITPTTTIVANKVNSFSGTIQGNVIIVKIGLQSNTGNEDETYNERFFLKNYEKCAPVAITSGLIVNFDACDENNDPNNQSAAQKVWFNKGTGGSTYDATAVRRNNSVVTGSQSVDYTSDGEKSFFQIRKNSASTFWAEKYFKFTPPIRSDMSWGIWFKSTDNRAAQASNAWWANAPIIGHEEGGAIDDWGISMGSGQISWGSGSSCTNTDQGVYTNNTYNDGNWHYLVVTRTNGNRSGNTGCSNAEVKIYVDGNLVNTFANIHSGNRTVSTIIGIGTSGSEWNGWNGDIAAVHGYNLILTADQITRNWNSQRSRFGL